MRHYTVINTEDDYKRAKEHMPIKRNGRHWTLHWESFADYLPVVFYYTNTENNTIDKWDGWDRLLHAEDNEQRGGVTRKDLFMSHLPDELFQM